MTVVTHLAMAIVGALFTAAILAFWAVASDAMHKEKTPPVAISALLAEAAAGNVDEITVRGTRYEYRLRGRAAIARVAYGPKTTAAELAPLAPGVKIDVK